MHIEHAHNGTVCPLNDPTRRDPDRAAYHYGDGVPTPGTVPLHAGLGTMVVGLLVFAALVMVVLVALAALKARNIDPVQKVAGALAPATPPAA